ncbi:Plant transposase [Melia azedarach]|uniref:Plant transposase n=1 Tax=Melia azedarach TaxID=155640 RepID=A0ACC1X5A5_MELAZ|nr:Plant transposase [Melia azedarach]
MAYWSTEKAKELSEINKNNRKKQRQLHVTGRKSFAQVRNEMKKKGEKTDRMSLYIKTCTKMDGIIHDLKSMEVIITREPSMTY